MAYEDIATLGINASTSNLERAIHKLEELQRAANGVEDSTDRLSRQSARATSATQRFARELQTASRSAVSFDHAVNSLITKLGTLVASFASLKASMDFMKLGVEFNSSIESSQIGIASLITSMVQLGDATGRPLQGMEKYKAAQGLAADMMKEIQKLGLETTATTKELVEGTQSIMGPAIQAGMALKDIPKFAVQGAQALQTLGLPLQQMRTELEALLTGNISRAQDVLAPKLFSEIEGDKLGDYIRKLKETGQLIPEIMKRLEPFKLAGEDVAKTWTGLVSNFKEAMEVLAGKSADGLTASLKESVTLMTKLILTTKEGSVGISDQFMGIAEVLNHIESAIGQGILSAVQSVANALQSVGAYINSVGSFHVFDDLATAAKMAAAAIAGIASAKIISGIRSSLGSALANARTAIDSYRLSAIETARVQYQTAQAERAAYEAYLMSAKGQQFAMASAENRNRILQQQIALLNQEVAAEQRLNSVQRMGTARSMLGAGFSGLVNMLGGPLNAAITVAVAGMTALAMKQSEAEKGANLYNSALQIQEKLTQKAAEAGKTLADKLSDVDEAQRRIAQNDALKSLEHFANEIKLLDFSSAIGAWGDETGSFKERAIELDEMAEKVRLNEMAFKDFQKELSATYVELDKAGLASTEFGERIKKALDIAAQGASAQQVIATLTGQTQELGNAAAGAATQIQSMLYAMNTAPVGDFIEDAKKKIRVLQGQAAGLDKNIKLLEVFKDADAKAVASWGAASDKGGYEAVSKMQSWQDFTIKAGFTPGDVDRAKEVFTISQQLNNQSKETNKILKERRKLQNGSDSASKKAASAAQKAATSQATYTGEVERTQEKIRSLQEQLSLNKSETYAIASAKAEEKYNIAISKTNEELKKRLANKSLTQSQAEELRKMKEQEASLQKQYDLEQAKTKQTQKNVQIAQGQIKFYKELAQMSGKYTDTLGLQKVLIAQQADEYINTYHIAEDLVAEWVRLQELQYSTDPFDGAYRGLLKFTSEYGDQAKTWEDLTYNFSKSFVDETGNMFDEFLETGKISLDGFRDLFKSFLKQLAWQAIAQPIMVNIVGSLLGTGGGGVASAAGFAGAATGGGFTGPLTTENGTVVGQVVNGVQQMGTNYVKNQLLGGESGLMGGIADTINSTMASWFPNTFQSAAGGFAGPITSNGVVVGESTVLPTFTSSLGTAAMGGMIGGIASPFVNSLFGIENNTGSSIGSMGGGLLGTIGGAMAAGSIAGPIGTIIGGAIGALGSLAGGALGGLLGTQPKQEPKLEVDLVGSLWKPISGELQDVGGWGDPSSTWDPVTGAFRASTQTSHGASGQYDMARAYGEVMQQTAEVSWGIADALGTITDDMKAQYLQNLENLGEINIHGIHRGDWINQENIQAFADWYVGEATGNMLIALSNIDLTPLTIAADGMAADTAEELGSAIGKIVSFVNIGQAIEDETMRNNFYDTIEGQMVNALDKVSLQPLAIAADGLAVDTVDELSTALKDVFAAYDLGESIQDEDLKKAYQTKMQELIEHAFDGVDLSFLRVDFDQNSFAGLQQAYAAIQAWEQVEDGINAVLKPTSEFTTQIEAASKQFDEWIKNLKALGWQEEAVAEVEAKRAGYMREIANNLSAEFKAFLNPVSEFETAMEAASRQFDEWIASLDKLGYTQEEIARIENRRTEYLWEYSRAMTKAMEQDLHLRMLALQYGSGSAQYSLQSLKYQQSNERESAASQYGVGSAVYQNLVMVQNAEYLQSLLDQLKSMREQAIQNEITAVQDKYQALIDPLDDQAKAIEAEIKARQKEITLLQRAMKPIQKEIQARQKELQAIENEISAKEREISEAERVADNFRRLAKSLKDVRAELWTGENNLTGTRYQESYRQFNELYRLAMSGDEEALDELGGKASDLLQLAREQLETRGEYNDAFYDVDQKLKRAQDYASTQVKKAESQIDLLQKQLDALNAQKAPIEAALAELQKQYDKMQEQLEAMQEGLEPLNDQLAAIQEQTQLLQQQMQAEVAQYQAMLAQYQAQQQTNMSLAQINAAIAQVEAALGQYMQKISSQQQYGVDAQQRMLEAQAAYANSIAFEGRTDWNAESTRRRILQDGTIEQWYDIHGKNQGGKVVPYDTNAARQAIVANKVAQLNATAYQGRTNWTAQDFYNAIGGNTAANIDKWYKEDGIKEGISSTYEASAYTNVLLDKNQRQSIKTANDNANLLNGSLNSQLSQSQYMSGTLDSLLFTDTSNWSRAIGGIDGAHSAIGVMNSNINGGFSNLSGVTGTMNGNINGGFSNTVSGLSTINQNLIGIGNKIGEGGYSGSSVNSGYTGSSTGGGYTGSSVGGSGVGSQVDEFARLPGNTGIYGSHYLTERALLRAKTAQVNSIRYLGRTDWTSQSVKAYMIAKSGGVATWYNGSGRAEGFAEGGITPADKAYVVGERGPEIMVSPRQWGVLNNEATNMLMNPPVPASPAKEDGGEDNERILAVLAVIVGYLQQITVKTGKSEVYAGKLYDVLRMFNSEGFPVREASN